MSRSARCASTCAAASARSASRSRPTFRGQGLGTALLEALLDDVAADPQVVALTAAVHVGNTPSMRAFARVGFVADGSDGEFRCSAATSRSPPAYPGRRRA